MSDRIVSMATRGTMRGLIGKTVEIGWSHEKWGSDTCVLLGIDGQWFHVELQNGRVLWAHEHIIDTIGLVGEEKSDE